MCKIAFIKFEKEMPLAERQVILRRLLINSWNMGNADGAGIFMFNNEITKEQLIKDIEIGTVLEDISASKEIFDNIIIHTRLATNAITIMNTQPLATPDIVLAHNGIVHTWERIGKKSTTNDSEIIIRLWEKYSDIKKVNERLGGSFNYILLDKIQRKLYLNSNTDKLHMVQQDGTIIVYQDKIQLEGIISSGLWSSLGRDIIDYRHYLELPVSEMMFDSYTEQKYFSYSANWQSNYLNLPNLRKTPVEKWDTPPSSPSYGIIERFYAWVYGINLSSSSMVLDSTNPKTKTKDELKVYLKLLMVIAFVGVTIASLMYVISPMIYNSLNTFYMQARQPQAYQTSFIPTSYISATSSAIPRGELYTASSDN